MRKHPVVLGFVLLIALGAVVYFMSYRAGVQSGGGMKGFSMNDKIGVVPVEGVIADSLEIAENLEAFGNDSSIVAVVVRIDSPGGGVAASQEIYDAVVALKKRKKW